MSENDYILRAEGVYKSYRMGAAEVKVLKGVDLRVVKGEFVSIVGASGSGKSTLLHILGALDGADKGTVSVEGRDLRGLSAHELNEFRNKKVGFVFQNADHQLFADTLAEEIAFALRNLHFPEEEIRHRITQFIDLFELTSYQSQSPFLLSGGERKRLALASVLCVEPSILILDEPTQAQDALQKQKLLDFIASFKSPEHILVLVTHDVEFAVNRSESVIQVSGVLGIGLE